jgi:hypothetical protein
MGVQGLADGFLAGFQTMDGYYRGQKADARADKELGLRDLQVHQGIEDSNRNFDLRKKGFDYGIETDKRDFKYRQGQDAINNTQQDKTIAISQGNLGLAQAANRRSEEAWSLQQEKYKQDKWQEENMPAIKVALTKLQSGEQLSEPENQLLYNPYAAKYNPFKVFGNQDFHSSIQTVMSKASALAKNPEAMVWDRSKLRSEINTPEVRSALGTVLRSQLDQGIGSQSQYGTVKAYGEPELIPTHRGTFVIQAPVTYIDDNGNESIKDAPITEGRSADGKAKVQEFTPQQLVNYFGQGAQASSSIRKNPEQWDTWSQAAGLSEPPDWKGYRQAVVKVQASAEKNVSAIQRDANMPQEQKQQAIEAERQAETDQVAGLRDVYGLKKLDQPKTDPLIEWAGQDPTRNAFISKLKVNNGDIAVKALVANQQLEPAFQAWQKQEQAVKQETHAQSLIDFITGSRKKPNEVDENGEPVSPY